MNILVYGGEGYTLNKVCLELLNEGFRISILNNLDSDYHSLYKLREEKSSLFQIYRANLLDKECVRQVFVENNINTVIHLGETDTVKENDSLFQNHSHYIITPTFVLCEVMQALNVKNLVYSANAVNRFSEKGPHLNNKVDQRIS